jgi:hypothetical protein
MRMAASATCSFHNFGVARDARMVGDYVAEGIERNTGVRFLTLVCALDEPGPRVPLWFDRLDEPAGSIGRKISVSWNGREITIAAAPSPRSPGRVSSPKSGLALGTASRPGIVRRGMIRQRIRNAKKRILVGAAPLIQFRAAGEIHKGQKCRGQARSPYVAKPSHGKCSRQIKRTKYRNRRG